MRTDGAWKPWHVTPNYVLSELSAERQEKRGKSGRRGPIPTNKPISIRQYIARAEQLKKI